MQKLLIASAGGQDVWRSPRRAEIRRTVKIHTNIIAQRGGVGDRPVRGPADRGVAAGVIWQAIGGSLGADTPRRAAVGRVVHLLAA